MSRIFQRRPGSLRVAIMVLGAALTLGSLYLLSQRAFDRQLHANEHENRTKISQLEEQVRALCSTSPDPEHCQPVTQQPPTVVVTPGATIIVPDTAGGGRSSPTTARSAPSASTPSPQPTSAPTTAAPPPPPPSTTSTTSRRPIITLPTIVRGSDVTPPRERQHDGHWLVGAVLFGLLVLVAITTRVR